MAEETEQTQDPVSTIPTKSADFFGKRTSAEEAQDKANKEAYEASIAEVRAAAVDCLNNELFKKYAIKYREMEKFHQEIVLQLDAKDPHFAIQFTKVQQSNIILGALMESVQNDAGLIKN